MKHFLKKTIAVTLACAFFTFLTLNTSAIEKIKDTGISGSITVDSLNRFNAYINSLNSESARIILDDKELVDFMQHDTFWIDNSSRINVLNSNVTLPLTEYPSGSYFSYNHLACTCHMYNGSSNCTWALPNSNFDNERCYNPHTGASGNCRMFDNSIQCAGFACYVFNQYTGGDHCSYYNWNGGTLIPTSGSDIHNFLGYHGVSVGTVIRGKLRNSSFYHSIVVTNVTAKGISFYQANYGGACLVSTSTKTWSQLYDFYENISAMFVP